MLRAVLSHKTPVRILASVAGALLLSLALMTACPSQAVAPNTAAAGYPMTDLLHCTRDQQILDALKLLAGTRGESSLQHVVQRPVRIFFKNLGELNKQVKDFDALSWLSSNGQQVIFINIKHQNAPPAALAALIAHEAMHDDPQNSIQEETAAWQIEGLVWMELKERDPWLQTIPNGRSSLVDRLNRIESAYRQNTLASLVRDNPGYHGLPETSPGFMEPMAAVKD